MADVRACSTISFHCSVSFSEPVGGQPSFEGGSWSSDRELTFERSYLMFGKMHTHPRMAVGEEYPRGPA